MGSVLAAGPRGLLLPGHVSNSPPSLFQSPPGLVGYWGFDADCLDLGNGLALDLSGFGNTGSLTSGATVAQGQVGGAVTFVGTGQINLGSLNYVSPSLPFTYSAWLKLNSFSLSQFPGPIQLQDAGGEGWQIFYSNFSGFQGISFGAQAAWARGLFNSLTVADGINHLLTITYNGAGQGTLSNFVLYLDGTPQTVSAGTSFGSAPAQANIIGQGGAWDGTIDETRIYNRALDPWEVIALYRAGMQGRREVL